MDFFPFKIKIETSCRLFPARLRLVFSLPQNDLDRSRLFSFAPSQNGGHGSLIASFHDKLSQASSLHFTVSDSCSTAYNWHFARYRTVCFSNALNPLDKQCTNRSNLASAFDRCQARQYAGKSPVMAFQKTLNLSDILENIAVISEVLSNSDAEDVPYYEAILQDLHLQLAEAEKDESSTAGPSGTNIHQVQINTSPGAAGLLPNGRKRGLDSSVDVPPAKRISAQPSPDTPGTPRLGADVPDTAGSQEWTLPTRPSHSGPVVDLTISDPPSPALALEPFVDPFPELVNAYRQDHGQAGPAGAFNQAFLPNNQRANGYRQDGGKIGPADAFGQDFMSNDDLVRFMINPIAAGGGYFFKQENMTQNGQPGRPGFPGHEVPYLPDPFQPPWVAGESDSDEYGEFPMNAVEADAIEKLLENIKEDGETPEDREPTPSIMCSTLKEYQKIGLTWLLKMENSISRGGILADEMGLGKTVRRISPCSPQVQRAFVSPGGVAQVSISVHSIIHSINYIFRFKHLPSYARGLPPIPSVRLPL